MPPHIPTQWMEVNIPTIKRKAYEALLSFDSISKPLVLNPRINIINIITSIPIVPKLLEASVEYPALFIAFFIYENFISEKY